MKNFLNLLFSLMSLLVFSCQKDSFRDANINRFVPIMTDNKETSTYLMMVMMGHDGTNCPGCVLVNGQLRHVDCQGVGSVCLNSSCVELHEVGKELVAITVDTFDLTSEDFFLMPDRSLDYTDDKNNHYYLNIPSQMVYRDSTTLQFTFTGLFFSEGPSYEND